MDQEGCAASNQGRGREPPDGHLHNGREPLPSSGHACSGAGGGPLPFHNQCGTIQQSPPSHIGVPQSFTAPSPFLHGSSGIRAPLAPTIHQAFTHFVP
uniref:Uncharacterized protein n=1 Tax=Oryza glumipatula TaxID=40148 RepID=A0A0E0AC48_9ORYZ